MIDENRGNACRVFLCYRHKTAQTANSFYLALKKCKSKYYGRVWYSDSEPIGNYCDDIPALLETVEYVFLFICSGFTENFLKPDGTTNYSNPLSDDNECVTVREIIEIEKQRQKRSNINIIAINNNSENLTLDDLHVLEQVFRNEGVLREDSIRFYKHLNQHKYDCRNEDPDEFIKRFDCIEIKAESQFPPIPAKSTIVELSALHKPLFPKYYGRDELFETVISAISGNCSSVCIYGNVGEGKTSFVFHLLNRISNEQYHGAQYVFYWEFTPSQGKFDLIDGVNQLLVGLMKLFGMKYNNINLREEQQVKTICECIIYNRVFLILDGFDLLLHHAGATSNRIANRTIKYLINTVARNATHSGSLLLLLSDRVLDELDYYSDNTLNIPIPPLLPGDCIRIMKDHGVKGKNELFLKTTSDLYNNPLAIILFSKHLMSICDGNIMEEAIPNTKFFFSNSINTETISLQNLISSYCHIWGEESCEWKIVTFLSIARRLISIDTFEQIVKDSDYMNSYNMLKPNQKKSIMDRLKKTGLMCNSNHVGLISVAKEFIINRFREKAPDQFRGCCKLLSDYYISLYDGSQVQNILDLEPIYDTIYYLIYAEKYNEAINIFWTKINRKREFFSQKKLGVISNDLFVISLFFDVHDQWIIDKAISDTDAAWLYSVAAYLMNNVGSLQEAEMLRRKEIDIYKSHGNTLSAAADTMHLARNLMMQCKFSEAESQYKSIIGTLNASDFKSITTRYSAAIDPKELLTSVQVRHAFLYYLKGSKYFASANGLIERNEKSATGKTYYYMIKCSTLTNQHDLRVLKKEITDFLDNAIIRGKNHELSYAFFLNAFLNCQILLHSKYTFNKKKKIKKILDQIAHSIDCADRAWRMDQYPFILICCSDILIDIIDSDKSIDIDNILSDTFMKLDNIFGICSLPLYEAMFSIVKLKLAIKKNNKEEKEIIRNYLEANPSVYSFFHDKISSLLKGEA